MILDHRVKESRHELANHRHAGMNVIAGDRIALLRHRTTGAPIFGIGFVYLADLCLHEQLHIGRDLAQRPGHQSQEAADLGDRVACRVPGDLWLTEPEFGHQSLLNIQAVCAERGQGARGPSELAHQHTGTQL